MAQQSPSCRWWSQVGGVLQKKKENTFRGHHLPWRKKKGEKKREKKRKCDEYGYRSRELWRDNLMVSPPKPQRHELGESLQFFQTNTNQALAGTLHWNQDNFSTLKPSLTMWLVHGNGPTEPQLQVVITGGWCVAKKKGKYIQRTPPPMEKKKRGKKKGKKKKMWRVRVSISRTLTWQSDGFTP